MSLHAISVFHKVKNEALKNCTSKAPLSASKKRKYASDQNAILISPHIDCCVRITGLPDRLFSGDIQSDIS